MRDSRFPRSVQLVARMIQPRCVIHDSLVTCIPIHDQITHGTLFNPFPAFPISCNKLHATIHDQPTHRTLFNPFGYSQFRASRCTTEPRTVRNKVRWFLREFFQTTYYQPSRALFISCNKLHATILAWIQTEKPCLTLQGHYDLSRINRVER